MPQPEDEEELLRSVALQNAQSIVLARRRAEEALYRQSELLRVTLASIGDGVITTDAQGRVTFLNHVAQALTGWTQDEANGKPLPIVFRIINERTRQPVESPVEKVLKHGQVAGLANHTVLVARNGTETPVDDSAAPIRDPEGNIIGAVLIFRDVTERKQAEALVDSQRQALQLLAEGAPLEEVLGFLAGLVERDSLNDTLASIIPLNEAGTHFQRGVGASLPEAFNMAVEGVPITFPSGLCANAVRRREAVAVHDFNEDPADHPFAEFVSPYGLRSGWSTPIVSSSGQILGTFANYYRHTGDPAPRNRKLVDMVVRTAAIAIERKRAEQASALLGAIVDSSDDAIVSKDLNGVIKSWNKGAERLFGYTAQEAIGQSVFMLIPPDRLTEEPQILDRLKRGERVDHYETVRVRKDGSLLDISLTISPVKDTAGRIIGASKIARDISEHKKAEEFMQSEAKRLDILVNERTAKLQETIGDMEAFSYSVSHDLRAPLRAMQGYADELLKESSLSPEGRTYLQRIHRAAGRLDRLTQEVLTYSQLTRSEINLHPIDLDKLVREVIEEYPQLHCQKALEVRSRLLPVVAHEGLLTQAVANLLVNACKFVAPGTVPKVVVRTEAVGKEVRMWVEDNGIGVAPEHRERLFKIFGRIHPDRKYEGTGIGLAIVKKAAERMGGTADFDSEPGKGSRFWIQLKKAKQIEK